MGLKEHIFAMTAASGPSGFEDGAVDCAAALLRPYVDELHRDIMGNLIGLRRSRKTGAKKVLLDAHIDEIGLIITGRAEGFLKFSALGGIDPRVLPTREVMLLTQPPIFGVIATMPPHVLSWEDMEKSQKIDELFIDCGLNAQEAEKIAPGTPAVFVSSPLALAGDRVSGKAMDDRFCFAVILRALELLGPDFRDLELYITASVQEELGTRGAKTAAFSIDPDLCIVLDVTHAATPDNPDESLMQLGGGVAIDFGPGMSRSISAKLKSLAQAENIPYQIEVEAGNPGTNSWPIQVSRGGVATGLLSLPLRYMHSPVELACLSDGEAAAKLLCAFLRDLGKEDA